MVLRPTEEVLISSTVECILFGCNTVLSAGAVYLLHRKKVVEEPLRMPFLATTLATYVLSTAHVVLFCLETSNNLKDQNGPGGSDESILEYSGVVVLLMTSVFVIQTMLAIAIIIYRVYIVYSSRIALLLVGSVFFLAALGIGVTFAIKFSQNDWLTFFTSDTARWAYAFFVLAHVINVGGNVAIAMSIWSARRKSSAFIRSQLRSPILILARDPMIFYSLSLLVVAILFATTGIEGFSLILYEWETQIISICFSMVIIRVGFGSLTQGIGQSHAGTTVHFVNAGQSQSSVDTHWSR